MSSNYWFINAVGVMVSSSGIPYQEYSYVGPEVIATAKETSEEVHAVHDFSLDNSQISLGKDH